VTETTESEREHNLHRVPTVVEGNISISVKAALELAAKLRRLSSILGEVGGNEDEKGRADFMAYAFELSAANWRDRVNT
jgi:hypothetical protein